MKPIIAFSGLMRSGKTEAARYVLSKTKDSHNSQLIKFAAPLYDIQEYIYGRIYQSVPEDKDRKLLQYLGTEWGREKDQNLWARIWEFDYNHARLFKGCELAISDDVRYDNEALKIRSLGGIIVRVVASDENRANRGPLENEGHLSEKGVDNGLIYGTIYNNGTVEELHKNLDYLVECLK